MEFVSFVGQTLDGKYKIEREIGRGGMGTVYLATHVGTERPVALKIIAPQFMSRPEFVERFRREARAAGRLRHPNVVDVTDFGFSESNEGKVAYLVMEYLDGVTLGEVLEEEQKLPLSWSLDILEQVCSAVHEAHAQGIIHRDLKPDNIWLEPNQRGGYTVKVLDFGIAKLEENMSGAMEEIHISNLPSLPTTSNFRQTTIGSETQTNTIIENQSSTIISEAGTMLQDNPNSEAGTILQTSESEDKTAIFGNDKNTVSIEENFKTKIMSAQIETANSPLNTPITKDLTRVGAVLGTPLYMSPEQCRGEKLEKSSDIYSLGIIAYQMLSGDTPFTGDFKTVMHAHKEILPPPLIVKKVPRSVRKVIHSALAKDAAQRPPTAEAFASELRSQSEGIVTLLRRALVIYSEHLPKFLGLTTLLSIPIIVTIFAMVIFSFLRVSGSIPEPWGDVLYNSAIGLWGIVTGFCIYLIIGATTLIVTQFLAVPLRPIAIRPALREAKKKWKRLVGTGLLSTVLTYLLGALTCGLGFFVLPVLWALTSPVVMMENLRGWKALKRSQQLTLRSIWTAIAAVFIMFLLPAILSGFISFFVNIFDRAFFPKVPENLPAVVQNQKSGENNSATDIEKKVENDININFGDPTKKKPLVKNMDMKTRVKDTFFQSVIHIFWLPMHIFLASFTSIIIALLYLKTRQAGGESLNELLEQFEDAESPRSNWQKRVRERLIQSGKVTSRASKSSESSL
ncbi:MAG TPA: protein kinase [Pyrinomonadaceae bacterium]|nr:protein kinase [Pyrinomonadaceae bacterium]